MRKKAFCIFLFSGLAFAIIFFQQSFILAEQHFRFVVGGDCRGDKTVINAEALGKFVELVKRLEPQPKFAVFTGDQVLSGGRAELEVFKAALEPLSSSGIPIYPLIGNHELLVGRIGQLDFIQAFDLPKNGPKKYEGLSYFIEGPNTLLIILDAYPYIGRWVSDNRIDLTQRRWLRQVLRDSPKAFKFVFAHPPAYPVDGHIGSSLDDHKTSRDALWRLFINEGVSAYFCGHEHTYARRMIDQEENPKWTRPIPQFIIGSTGSYLHTTQKAACEKFIPTFHYAVVDVYPTRFKVKVYDLNNVMIDAYKSGKL